MKFRTFWGGSVLIFILVITVINDVEGIDAPFISAWTPMASDTTSPVVIPHTLGEIPAKVDVQVKVTYNGIDYMFPGMGSAQRDDDLATDYGGVGYLYNEFEVKVYVPVATSSGNGLGWAITTGGGLYAGPFTGSFTNCDVRVRAWKLSYWPPPSFDGSSSISTSSPYINVPHSLGVYPDFVTVQLTLSNGYMSEAQGTTATTADHSAKWINSCGTIFGVTDSSVTLWAAAAADDFVACFKDGWGSEDISFSSATVVIRAWVLTSSEMIQNDVYPYTQIVSSLQPQLTSLFDTDYHLVIVETRDNSIASGRAFYGAGSASQGELNEPFGGTLYGYNQSHIVLWTSDVSYGKPIYVDGIWGGGSDPLQTSDVLITVRVIATGTLIIPAVECPPPPSIADGYYEFSNDTVQYHCNQGFSANQTKNNFHCNDTMWEDITFSCEVMMCQAPISIANAINISSGYQNGSQTLYSCMTGYAGNNGNRITTCNGTHWTNTNLTCSENILSTNSCGLPPYIIDAFIEIENNTVIYHCRDGFNANQSTNTAYCVNGQWTQLTLGCINQTCGKPPNITNTLKLSNGSNNGSMTLYTCTSGFSSNDEDPTIFCNGTYWSNSDFRCSADITCGLPPNVLNAYYVIDNKTATYQCFPGYTQSTPDNVIHCNESGWNTPIFKCLDLFCGAPQEIPNAIKVSDGYLNGSITLYSCLSGFLGNNESPFVSCNGSHWSNSLFQCKENLNCGLPPELPNGYYVVDNGTAIYYCLPGYTAIGQNNISHCNESIWDSPNLTCRAQLCPTPTDIANTVKISSGSNNGSLTVYTCESGFVSNGEDPFISCNGTHWTNTLFACHGESCPSPPDIGNTIKMSNGSTNGSLTVYTCVSGFVDNGEDPFISCNGTEWTNTVFACSVSSDCGSPPNLPNSTYVLENKTTAVYSCLPGYISNNSSNAIYCKDYVWSNISLTCSAQSCSSPPDIPNTIKIFSGASNGSLTVYTCVSGFVDNGEDPFVSCNGTHWTNTLFACSVSNECSTPPSVSNATYVLENQTTAVYSCLPGYIFNNTDNTIYCKDSVWSNISLTCTAQICPSPPDIVNAFQISGGLNNGSLTVYTCVSGFVANGEDPYISCNGTHWTNSLFACSVSNECSTPPSLSNATYVLKNQTTAVYSCLPGYISNNTDNAIYCKDSVWSNISLTCTAQICPSPPDIVNAFQISGGLNNGSLTVYTCVSGFVANGEDPYISCNGTHWTNTLFACSVSNECSTPPSVSNATYVLENQTTAVYSCLPGYISNNTDNTIYCKDSVWSNISLTCTAQICPSPPDIVNAFQISGGLNNGSLTVYTCVSGFVANGEDPYISCNGTHWTNTLFACSDIVCQEPPNLHNADILKEGMQAGHSALYSCIEGYVAIGGPTTITCNGTHWSETNFTCLEGSLQSSQCGSPPTLLNAYYEIVNNTATYHCHYGYTANQTNNVIICLQQQWAEPNLSCLDISCPTPPDIVNAVKISEGLHNGSVAMYACLPDYIPNSAVNTIVCNETSWTQTNFSCSSAPKVCGLPPSIPHGYYTVQNEVASYHCLSGYTANTTISTIQCTGAVWGQLQLHCIAVANFTSTVLIDGKFAKLRIPKNITNAYERSLNCADDPRPSARAIGGVGAAILCLVAGLIFLSDVVTILQHAKFKAFQRRPSSPLDPPNEFKGHVYVEETSEIVT